ncbi:MAG: hypothetical protein WCG27_11110, partial [Pseudomonadota bacterium]
DNEASKEVGKVLRGSWGNPVVLAPYIVSEEKRIAETITSKYMVLLMGGRMSQQTEEVQVAKEGVLKSFFHHNYANISFVENPLSWLFAAFLKSVLKLDWNPSVLASEAKYVHIEYESVRDLIKNQQTYVINRSPGDTPVEDYNNIMISLRGEYYARKTTGWLNSKFKDRAMEWMDGYPDIPQTIKDNVKSNYLRGPLRISTKFDFKNEGMAFFHQLTVEQAAAIILHICDEYPLYNFLAPPKQIFEASNGPRAICLSSIQKKYVAYHKELIKQLAAQHTEDPLMVVPLWKLKDFVRNLFLYAKHKEYIDQFFGVDNIMFVGSIEAKTKDGKDFQTYFGGGRFIGPGLAESYVNQRSSGTSAGQILRVPASGVL